MAEPDEPILVQRAVAGDYDAFSLLIARYEKRLYALAWHLMRDHHDAQDVVQNALMAVVEHIGEFRGESPFSSWLMRITANHALKAIRSRRIRRTQSLDDSQDDGEISAPQYIADWREEPLAAVDRRELRETLDEGLGQLSDGQRLAFVLRDMEGFSTAESAEALGISQNNLKVRLLRARLALREYLTRRFGDERTRKEPSHEGHDHSSLLELLVQHEAGGNRP